MGITRNKLRKCAALKRSKLLATCPHCKQEVQPDSRFCQRCGFSLWRAWNGITLSRLFGSVEAGKCVHRLARDKLWKIGKDAGFRLITEFVPPNIVLQRQSDLIDVVWKSGDDMEFAFEIRAKESDLNVLADQDDVQKLSHLKCPKKFLVNVSSKTGKAYFNEITEESIVTAQVFPRNQAVADQILVKMPSSDEIVERFGSVEPGKKVRQEAEMKLGKIGRDLGFNASIEYEAFNLLGDGRTRYISVVWKKGQDIVAAFQIRRKKHFLRALNSAKDWNKLHSLVATEKYLVNVSERSGKAHFHRVTYWRSPDLWTNLELENEKAQQGQDTCTVKKSTPEQPSTNVESKERIPKEVKLEPFLEPANLGILFDRVETDGNIYQNTKDKLRKIGISLGYLPIREYFMRDPTTPEKFIKIDEVWKSGSTIVAAFLIRSKYQDLDKVGDVQQILRLQKFPANKKFVVNVSKITGKAKFNELDGGAVKATQVQETNLFTLLVKSEKYGKICIACVDENGRWIRPIKPGGFEERDLVMDNGRVIDIFDVVEMKFGAPFPIKHHKENKLFSVGTSIRFVGRLGEPERKSLLSIIADTRVLGVVSSRGELFDELSNNLGRSLVLAGPVDSFGIQCNVVAGKTHPRIWIVRPADKQRMFSITCTDLAFCDFVRSKFANLEAGDGVINSQDIAELKDKQAYFVIGLTGDSLDENNEIRDGKFAPPESSMQPRYWPMVVSVLTVPSYLNED